MSNLLDDELQLERLKLKLVIQQISQEVEQTVCRHAQTAATV